MKVAIVTDDKKAVSKHFGRAKYYKIYHIENGAIVDEEMRDRFSPHAQGNHSHDNSHNQEEENHEFHGMSSDAKDKHTQMAEQINDCDMLIAGGMGRGAYIHFNNAGIQVVMTEIEVTDEVVDKLIKGELVNRFNELTH